MEGRTPFTFQTVMHARGNNGGRSFNGTEYALHIHNCDRDSSCHASSIKCSMAWPRRLKSKPDLAPVQACRSRSALAWWLIVNWSSATRGGLNAFEGCEAEKPAALRRRHRFPAKPWSGSAAHRNVGRLRLDSPLTESDLDRADSCGQDMDRPHLRTANRPLRLMFVSRSVVDQRTPDRAR